jgi:hypothetical protein
MRKYAKRLIACAAHEITASKTKTPTAFQVSNKLRPQLVNLMGEDGFARLFRARLR